MMIRKIVAGVLVVSMLVGGFSAPVYAAEAFDAAFYAATYGDVVEVLGSDPMVLYEHYQNYGMKEKRLPNAAAKPGAPASAPVSAAVEENAKAENGIVALKDIPGLSTLKKKCTDAEIQKAYDVALDIVKPLVGKSEEDQLAGVAIKLREIYDNGGIAYSMSNAHYNDPYGYLVAGTASCAGCARTTIFCLRMLGFTSVEHVHENKYCHQWARVKMSDGTYAICDAFGLYCGSEIEPYKHPYAQ